MLRAAVQRLQSNAESNLNHQKGLALAAGPVPGATQAVAQLMQRLENIAACGQLRGVWRCTVTPLAVLRTTTGMQILKSQCALSTFALFKLLRFSSPSAYVGAILVAFEVAAWTSPLPSVGDDPSGEGLPDAWKFESEV